MKRMIDRQLHRWKEDKHRKVLLVRGARQIGKTYSIKQLGKTFKYFIEVNFEETPAVKSFFENSLTPQGICEKLSVYYDTPIKPGETLLFFDEIQACPNALKSLRFFYEKAPELHVIAAGSLLEFALESLPSFGVGRIKSLFMYPMTFSEFLVAEGNDLLEKAITEASPLNPLDEPIHQKALERLKIFMLMGGMPEVVKTYLRERDLLLCGEIIDDILTTLKDDFSKYKEKLPANRLQEVFGSMVSQVGGKFKYSHVAQGKTQIYKEALDLLVRAGLAYKVYHTSAGGLPLGAQVNHKKFKVLMMDTGMYQRVLGLDVADYIVSDFASIINKGNLTELFVGLELIAHGAAGVHSDLHNWHREARSSNAEVDYVIAKKNKIIPLEVKAGTRGGMQSMHLFLKERELDMGLRISSENFAAYDNIRTIPLYAVKNIRQGD
ncbi:MAG: ATP-binding protein [bacterium]|nr:ATP-binding protein [bacterium]